MWAIDIRRVDPAAAGLQDVHDAADNPPVIDPRLASSVGRQKWGEPRKLIFRQPETIPVAAAPTLDPVRRISPMATFVGELVDDVEHAVLPAIVGAVLDEVVGPDVIGMLRPQPDARPLVSQSRPRLGCFWGTFSPHAARPARPACR